MPTIAEYRPDPALVRAARAELRRKLLAKGLMEGSSKYQEVFARKLPRAIQLLSRG